MDTQVFAIIQRVGRRIRLDHRECDSGRVRVGCCLWWRGSRTRTSQPAQANEVLFVHQKGHRDRRGNEMMSSGPLDLSRSFATTHDLSDARNTVVVSGFALNESVDLR